MTLTQHGSSWRLDNRAGGQRVRRMFKSLTEAQEFISQGNGKPSPAIEAQASQQPHALPIGEAVKRWRTHCNSLRRHSFNHKERIDYAVKQLRAHFGDRPADTIGRADFDGYVAARTATGVSLGTVKKEYNVLAAALSWCVSRDIIARFALAGYFRGVRIIEKQITVPQPDDLARIMAALPADGRKLFWFLLSTGCRISEACAFDVSDIGADFIRFHRNCKGGYERTAPLPAFPYPLPIAGLAFSYAGREWRRNTFMHLLWRACGTAGVARISPHCTRHAHATFMLAKGEPVYNLMAACGWRSFSVMQRYVAISRRYQNCGAFPPQWVGLFLLVSWADYGQIFAALKRELFAHQTHVYACHGRGCEFKSRLSRQSEIRRSTCKNKGFGGFL